MKSNKFLIVAAVILVAVFMVGCGSDSSLPVFTSTPKPTSVPKPTPTPEPTPVLISGIDESVTVDGVEILITDVTITKKYVISPTNSIEPGGDFDILIMVEGKVINGNLNKIFAWTTSTRLYWTRSNGEENSIVSRFSIVRDKTNEFVFAFVSNINSTDWEIELPGIHIPLDRFVPFQEFVQEFVP